MKKIIASDSLPAAIGPYSHGYMVNGMLFTSGQLPVNPVSGQMSNNIAEQTEQSLLNVKAVLAVEGVEMKDIVSTTVYLSDINNFAKMNEVYAKFFDGSYPVRTCVEVARLPKDALVEISVIAVKE